MHNLWIWSFWLSFTFFYIFYYHHLHGFIYSLYLSWLVAMMNLHEFTKFIAYVHRFIAASIDSIDWCFLCHTCQEKMPSSTSSTWFRPTKARYSVELLSCDWCGQLVQLRQKPNGQSKTAISLPEVWGSHTLYNIRCACGGQLQQLFYRREVLYVAKPSPRLQCLCVCNTR